jgi:hypothetical protein
MVNFCGIPIWAQTGRVISVIKFPIMNTHCPAVHQCGSLLVASYLISPKLDSIKSILSTDVRLMWPFNFPRPLPPKKNNGLFSSFKKPEIVYHDWLTHCQSDLYIGCYFTKKFIKQRSDHCFQSSRDVKSQHFFEAVCKYKQVSLIVVVGTFEEYSSLNAFISNRLKPISDKLVENTNNGKYYVRVEDGDNVIEYECNLENPYKKMFVESPDIAPSTNVSCCFVAVV